MKSILITGCNRGIGLGLVKHLLRLPQPPESIFATCRDVAKAAELKEIADKSGNVHIIELDVTDTKSYDRVIQIISEKVGENGLNVLINNAGIANKFARLNLVKEEQLLDTFKVNTVAPIMLSKACLPLLKQASSIYPDKGAMNISRAAIIHMSSSLGSITDNTSGGFYPYRCSKSALNAAAKSMSIDLKDDGILVACMHPGWVRTDMGGINATLDVDISVSGMLSVLQGLTENDNGTYVQHDGKVLPW
ncbi:uncharacterized protein LOC105698305 [Orussus abietinus]|uniref:uncharacterized protein LOC105698305 n=1 Tax=Orussus abietinus TaxID=222816 RepID=UPI0006254555|nr:uncharacterized protein LOC105698305 [Orussus abietinus]XP_012277881.1 uncharacterized protein LOC105698305 [Orussus abietinus]